MKTNEIYCTDYRELLRQLPNQSVDLILTDPPYGISYQNNFTSHKHRYIDGDTGIDYSRFALECYRVLKDNRHAYFFTRFDRYPFHFNCLMSAGFQVKNCLIIEKGTIGGIGDLNGSYANNSEWIIFCQKGRRPFEKTQLVQRKRKASHKFRTRLNSCWFGNGYPKSTYNPSWLKKAGIFHPTVKSVECLEWLIQLSSQPDELVLDPFIGTGSTALAALNQNRRYLGSEIDREYFMLAKNRLERCRKLHLSNLTEKSVPYE